ncbi:YdfR family protein [Escherichia coli]
MKKKYELVVKGINNYPDKITVTVALEIGGYPSLLLPDVAISLDRTEGATLEFYEAEAKKQAKKFFMDVAAGLCEGDELSPEKRPIILEAQNVWITYKGKLPGRITGSLKTPPAALRSEKDDIESPIEKLEGRVADLNKKLSVLIPSEDEKKRRDEQFAAFYDYCIEVTRRNFVKIFEEGKSLQ